jgi:hypothetical protein
MSDVIAATCGRWEGYAGHNERDVFGTTDPATIARAVDGFCLAHLGSPVARYEFYATSVCGVHGVRLADGRGVVLKVHRAGADREHLSAVHDVQRHLASRGFPAPRPLLGPIELSNGVAVAEELLQAGQWRDGHEPDTRRLIAGGLARQIALCRELAPRRGLKPRSLVVRQLWARPHDRRFDFPATADGAGWIERLAAEAQRRLDEQGAGETAIGHYDWRVEHLRFEGDELVAVWDWDSVAAGPEPACVGAVAHAFVSDWGVEDLRYVPTPEEALAFIGDYEAARGRDFSPAERRTAEASLVAAAAYSARCEHADELTDMGHVAPRPAPSEVPASSFRGFLAVCGPEFLGIGDLPIPDLAEE